MKEQATSQILSLSKRTLEYNKLKRFFNYLITWVLQVIPIQNFFKSNLPLILLLPISFLIIFTGLDDSVLQVDEGGDTFISTTILKYGLPMHSDGLNHTMPFANIFDGIFVYRTWIPYYLQALSLHLMGNNTFAARFPFAIAGLFAIFCLYHFAFRLTQIRRAAIFAATFLATSVPALLYFRISRYVAIPILLTPILLLFYIDIFEKKKWNSLPFTLTSIIYFHTMYVEFAALIIGLLTHLYIFRKDINPSNLKRIKTPATIIAVMCLPWLFFIPMLTKQITAFYMSSGPLIDTTNLGYLKHFVGFLFQINNYIFPFILMPFIFSIPFKNFGRSVSLLVISSISIIFVSTLHSIPLLQYITACIPILFTLLGWMIAFLFKGSIVRQCIFSAILIFSNIVHVGPLVPCKELFSSIFNDPQANIQIQSIRQTILREVQFKSNFFQYWRELANPYQGPLDKIVSFFETHGKKGETCYIDNELESLAFYTGFKMIHHKELDIKSKPDWIVLRGNQWDLRSANNPIKEKLNFIIKNNQYEKILLNAPVGRINNAYDIQIHLFQSPTSTNKVHIFRRSGIV